MRALNRIQAGRFNCDYFRSLSLSVIDRRPDTDIWAAVFSLKNTLSHVTPPPSAPPPFDDTPITRSSSSFQGGAQTRRILEPGLFYEVQHCTLRSVEGFVEEYFDNKSWEGRSREIFSLVKRKKEAEEEQGSLRAMDEHF